MARSTTIDEVVLEAISPVVARIAASIARDVSALVAREITAAKKARAAAAARARPAARRARRVEMTRWVANRRARRVPSFVIELTGLDTKKKIVARFGENAAFAKGKPLPPEGKAAQPRREVKAKPPTIRKKAAAA
jgi:hypothetical protein